MCLSSSQTRNVRNPSPPTETIVQWRSFQASSVLFVALAADGAILEVVQLHSDLLLLFTALLSMF